MTQNPKLKTTIEAVTKLLIQEGPLTYDQILAMTGKSPIILSAALSEMVTFGQVHHGTDRATGKNKYLLSNKAEKEATAKAQEKAEAKKAAKKAEKLAATPKEEPKEELVTYQAPYPERVRCTHKLVVQDVTHLAPLPEPEPEPKALTAAKPHKYLKPAKPRVKRLAANPMVGCFLHNGNIIIKLDRRANNSVSLSVDDAAVFLGLLNNLIDKTKAAE